MKIKILVVLLIIIALIVIGGAFLLHNRVQIKEVFKGSTVFKYGETEEVNSLLEQDIDMIIKIFNGNFMYNDNPSCGFSEDISIQFNDSEIFCFAHDTCPIVYWKNKNRYFKISDYQKAKLYEILYKYGFYFPCV